MEDKNGLKTNNDKNKKLDKLMNRFREELAQDATIDRTELSNEIVTSTSIQAKWLNYYMIYKEQYIVRTKRLKELNSRKYLEMVTGVSGMSVTKTEAKTIIGGDKEIVDLEEMIDIIETVMDFCLSAQKIIRDKSFAIGNLITLTEFEAGK